MAEGECRAEPSGQWLAGAHPPTRSVPYSMNMAHTESDPAGGMMRVTITVPTDVAAEVDAWLSRGAAANRSRFVHDALRLYCRHLEASHLAAEAAKLDEDEEEALSLAAFGISAPPPTTGTRR